MRSTCARRPCTGEGWSRARRRRCSAPRSPPAAPRRAPARAAVRDPRARIQPIAHVTSSRVWPVMCGTLKRSRTIVTPAPRHRLDRPRPVLAEPEVRGLELAHQVGVGDLVEQRRERVVHQRLLVGAGRRGHAAVLAGGNDVSGRGGVSPGRRPEPPSARTPPRRARRSWTWPRHATVAACSPRCLPRPRSRSRRTSRRRGATRTGGPGRSRSPYAPRTRFWGCGRRSRVPVRERAQGDAARRLRPRRARPSAARRRARAARADDPALGQPRRQRDLHPRRHRPGSTVSRARRA